MSYKEYCDLCGEVLEKVPSIHDVVKCEKTELLKNRETIQKLRAELHDWKFGPNGWYDLRDIIGKLWWRHQAKP